jgi:hypothetical protein
MPCEWRGNMANDPRTSLFVITKGDGFSKSKGFLKHDHFGIQKFKTIREKKIRTNNLH